MNKSVALVAILFVSIGVGCIVGGLITPSQILVYDHGVTGIRIERPYIESKDRFTVIKDSNYHVQERFNINLGISVFGGCLILGSVIILLKKPRVKN